MDSLFENIGSSGGAAPLTLSQFNAMVRRAVSVASELRGRWVTAELADVNYSGGHCYMMLVEKNERGDTVARMRATVWRSNVQTINTRMQRCGGASLRSGIKVMLFGSAEFHPQYGMSVNVTDIDPSYTLGDMERIRREILAELTRQGVVNDNKALELSPVMQRIAVISAPGAAGYGDFMNQLTSNPYGIQFYPVLYQATMQGVSASASVMDALARIEQTIDVWDCVVIIRGGGSSTDMNGFDTLELARAVATCPLPVIVGIGHERDRCVLDEIACRRVKTPTAAAEFLIAHALETANRVVTLVRSVTEQAQAALAGSMRQLSELETFLHATAKDRLSSAMRRLAELGTLIPATATGRVSAARMRLDGVTTALPGAAAGKLRAEHQRLDHLADTLRQSATAIISRQTERLDALARLADALSPDHILRRGYSLTTYNGKAVRRAGDVPAGAPLLTYLADGRIASVACGPDPQPLTQ